MDRLAKRIKGILFDLDGTLWYRGQVIEGANESLEWARGRGLEVKILTNVDTGTGEMIRAQLVAGGLNVRPGEIYTPADAALTFIRQNPGKRFHFLVSRRLTTFFRPFSVADPPSDFVVVGNCRDNLSYDRINTAFRHLYEGAQLVALQKGKYLARADGYHIDTGAFVAALEYASGQTALLLGKPEKSFFLGCLAEMGLGPEEVLIVGDSVTTDIEGAVRIGAAAMLVRTGNYRPGDEQRIAALPPWFEVIGSVRDIPRVLE